MHKVRFLECEILNKYLISSLFGKLNKCMSGDFKIFLFRLVIFISNKHFSFPFLHGSFHLFFRAIASVLGVSSPMLELNVSCFKLPVLIHVVDPQSLPIVITVFTHCSTSVRHHFSKSLKTKQSSSENSDRHWQDGSGRGDHWWLTCHVASIWYATFIAYCKITLYTYLINFSLFFQCKLWLTRSLATTMKIQIRTPTIHLPNFQCSSKGITS